VQELFRFRDLRVKTPIDRAPVTSGLRRQADILGLRRHVSNVPIAQVILQPMIFNRWQRKGRTDELHRSVSSCAREYVNASRRRSGLTARAKA